MTQLNESLQALTSSFVEGLIDEIFSAPLEDLVEMSTEHKRNGTAPRSRPQASRAPKAKGAKAPAAASGRLARRSPEEIGAAVDTVVKLLRTHKDGLRSEEIRKALDLDVRELPRVLQQGLSDKRIVVLSGQKRSTAYGVKGTKATRKPAAKASKKTKRSAPKAAAKRSGKAKKAAPRKKKAVAVPPAAAAA